MPVVAADDETAVLDLLVTEREAAIAEATRLRNQAHQLLLLLDPDYAQQLPGLRIKAGARALEAYTTADPLCWPFTLSANKTLALSRTDCQKIRHNGINVQHTPIYAVPGGLHHAHQRAA